MEGEWFVILRAFVTACIGVFFLAAAIQGWFWGAHSNWVVRGILLIAALCMIEGSPTAHREAETAKAHRG